MHLGITITSKPSKSHRFNQFLLPRLHEVGLFTAVKQEGNYQTGQVRHHDDGWIVINYTLEEIFVCLNKRIHTHAHTHLSAVRIVSVQQITQLNSMLTIERRKRNCAYRLLIIVMKMNNMNFVDQFDDLIVQDCSMFVLDFLHWMLLNQFVEEVLVQLL